MASTNGVIFPESMANFLTNPVDICFGSMPVRSTAPAPASSLKEMWLPPTNRSKQIYQRISYFENRNTPVGVKDDDVIAYYKKGITNIKLFEKIHEADAKTIDDLMAYVDKLVDTQDAVMHNFNGEDHDNRGTRSRKRSGEAYVTDPPRPSTSSKVTSIWSWTTSVSSTAMPSTP
jgi:hypothetical protein